MNATEAQHESKVRFLDAALQVIRTKGYSATRIEDICEAAGLTKGSFFHHFATKEDLALAAAAHFAAMADGLFATAPYQKLADPLERLLGYVDFRIAILQGPLPRSEEHTSELQSQSNLVCRLLLEKKKVGTSIGRLASGPASVVDQVRLRL